MDQVFLALGVLFAATSVVVSTFGAHAWRQRLSVDHLALLDTAARFQMYHAFALLAVGAGLLLERNPATINVAHPSPWLVVSGGLFCSGIVLFSGSLYVLAFARTQVLAMATPIGSVAFVLGWLALLVAAVT